jgi:hypothetical protein
MYSGTALELTHTFERRVQAPGTAQGPAT